MAAKARVDRAGAIRTGKLDAPPPDLPRAAGPVSLGANHAPGLLPPVAPDGVKRARKLDDLKKTLWAKAKEAIVAIVVWLLQLMKSAVKDAIKANIETTRLGPGGSGASASADDALVERIRTMMLRGVNAAAPKVSAFAVGLIRDKLNDKVVGPLVMAMVKRKWPHLAGIEPAITSGTSKLLSHATKVFGADDVFAAPARAFGVKVTNQIIGAVAGSESLSAGTR